MIGIPTHIQGSSRLDGALMDLRKVEDATHRPSAQGMYEDSSGEKWYVKRTDEPFATKEALAADYFNFLLGPGFSPETRALSTADGATYVVSRYNERLSEISPEGALPIRLIDALAASYLVGDGDCLLKNIKQCEGSVFKIDFGAAMDLLAAGNKEIPFLSFFGDLRIGFEGRYLHERTDPAEFREAMQRLASINPEEFHWREWQAATVGMPELRLEEIKAAVIERHRLLLEHFKGTPPVMSEPFPILVDFYRLLIEEKKAKGDFPIFDLSPEYLAQLHQRFYEEHGAHPPCYSERARQAGLKMLLCGSCKTLEMAGIARPNALDCFLQASAGAMAVAFPSASCPAGGMLPLTMAGPRIEAHAERRKSQTVATPSKDALRAKYKEFSAASLAIFSIFKEEKTAEESIAILRERAKGKDTGASAQTLKSFGLE